MNEIKCPNCGEVFTVNESQYAELLSQVRTAEFDKELHDRMKQELALAEQKAMNEQQSKLTQKDQEAAGVTPNQIRLSIGLENVDDLIEDLRLALEKI